MGRPIPQSSGAGSRFGPFCWLLLLAPLLPFVYAFGFLFPRGDDFDEVTRAMFLFDLPGGLYEIGREWLIWSGRYTYHFLAVFLGKAGELRPAYGLVCAAVAALYGLAVYGLARETGGGERISRRDAAFCGCFAVLALFCCHQNLQTFYMLTDALTMGLQPTLALCFLWALCRLWRVQADADAVKTKRARRAAIATGVLAVGVYEHSAAAVALCAGAACVLAWRADREAGNSQAVGTGRRLRDFLQVGAWCLGALLFSFLAPGNFYRKAVRHISPDVQWQQLCAAWDEWLRSAFWFFDGLWPWAVLALVVFLRLARPADAGGKTARGRKKALWLAGTAIVTYLLLSGGLTILHALSDVTISSSDKLPAGLSLYAACAFGFALHALLGTANPAPHLIRRLPPWLPLLALVGAFCLSGNLSQTFVNAVNGNMMILAETLSRRYGYLAALGAAEAKADDAPKFGLLGEIYRPDARKRRIDPALPQAVVQELPPAPVFPIHMGETLPDEAEAWPNLWVAWMYGVGGVRSSRPDPLTAVRNVGNAATPTVLTVPPALRERGVSAAWRVRAQGGPNITFADTWLVLRADGPLPESIAVLRPNPPDRRRLAPLPVQNWLLTRLLEQDSLKIGFCERLTGEPLSFKTKLWRTAGFYAFPLGPAGENWPGLFLSLDRRNFYRLPDA